MSGSEPSFVLLGGFGRSGLGAINDLLLPHPEILATPYELRLLTDPDGLLSLESALIDNWTAWQADFAIARFRELARNMYGKWRGTYVGSGYGGRFGVDYRRAVDTFLGHLVSFSYRGVWAGRATLWNKGLLRLTKPRRYFFNSAKVFFAPEQTRDAFHTHTREFLRNLYRGAVAAKGATQVVINEPFVSQCAARCLQLAGSTRLLIVTRDPRDSFGSFRTRDWSPQKLAQAVEFQKRAQQRWLRQRAELPASLFLELKLEDLVSDPPTVIERLERFLEIRIPPEVVAQSRFSPERAHVGRWKKQFDRAEQKLIHDALSEILREYGYE